MNVSVRSTSKDSLLAPKTQYERLARATDKPTQSEMSIYQARQTCGWSSSESDVSRCFQLMTDSSEVEARQT